MATKKRGNCKKYGRVQTGPRKGLCRKGPAGKKRKGAAKAGKRRPNCEKWGFSVLLGRCRRGPGGKREHPLLTQAKREAARRGQALHPLAVQAAKEAARRSASRTGLVSDIYGS
jgi:hypothetical protein